MIYSFKGAPHNAHLWFRAMTLLCIIVSGVPFLYSISNRYFRFWPPGTFSSVVCAAARHGCSTVLNQDSRTVPLSSEPIRNKTDISCVFINAWYVRFFIKYPCNAENLLDKNTQGSGRRAIPFCRLINPLVVLSQALAAKCQYRLVACRYRARRIWHE